MVIFLDIDGVLNQLQSWHIDKKCVKNLGLLCSGLNATVVLTSSWRPGYCRNFDKCSPQIQKFLSICQEYHIRVEGRTRDFDNRTEEIRDYCNRHNIAKYLILDDDSSLFSDTTNLYLVNYKTGFTKHDVKRIFKQRRNLHSNCTKSIQKFNNTTSI